MMSDVQYIHSLNIVHRDIKPENVLMTNNEDLSWAAMLTIPKIRCQVGTVLYMAPEVILDEEYDAKVDLWWCGP